MAVYVVGDIQGCFYSFQNLLEKISFDSKKDELWLVGDLVNRGKGSFKVMDWCLKNQSAINAVLGNHELHFLAVALKQSNLKSSDTIKDILNSSKKKEIIDWVLNLPLILNKKNFLLVHAGIIPEWSIFDIKRLSNLVCNDLIKHPEKFLKNMYGNFPNLWSNNLRGNDRNRFVVNAMTRMRCLNQKDGSINFDYKGDIEKMPKELIAWFDNSFTNLKDCKIISGHWSAIGVKKHMNGISIDSGCIWGRSLTAYNLSNNALFSVEADKRDLI